MKFRRCLSGLLFGLGCALLFVGLLAMALSGSDNPQLRLVLASLAGAAVIGFALTNAPQVALLGVMAMVCGAVLMNRFAKRARQKRPPVRRPASFQPQPERPNPFAVERCESIAKRPALYQAGPILERNRYDE